MADKILTKIGRLSWRLRGAIFALGLAAAIFPWVLEQFAPSLQQDFASAQIHPHKEDMWAVAYKPNLPFYWQVWQSDLGRGTVSDGHFTENGQAFGLPNEPFWHYTERLPEIKYWSYISSKGRAKDMNLPAKQMIYFAMGSNEDPSRNGKSYAFSTPTHVSRLVWNICHSLVVIALVLLAAAARHRLVLRDYLNFYAKLVNYAAGLAVIMFAGWLYVMSTPPVIEHKFENKDIFYLHDNAWLAVFRTDIPNWRMIRANDYINRIKSAADFFENGAQFPGMNKDCLQEYAWRDFTAKCWDHIPVSHVGYLQHILTEKGQSNASLNHLFYDAIAHPNSVHFILLRLPQGQDPHLNGKTYHVSAKLFPQKSLSLTVISLCLLLLLPLCLRYAKHPHQFAKRLSITVFAMILIGVTVNALYYSGLFYAKPIYLLDSYGYIKLSLIRPIGTWLFFQGIKLWGDFDRLLIPIQYCMTVGGMAWLAWQSGKILQRYWLGWLLLVIFLVEWIVIAYPVNLWSDLVYGVLSEPLFITSLAMAFACLYGLMMAKTPRRAYSFAAGLGFFLVLADITRAIGLAFFVIIPLYAAWHIYATTLWRSTMKQVLFMVAPIILVLGGQSTFQKIHYGAWGAGGGGAGLFLLAQTAAIITPERAAAMRCADTPQGSDECALAKNLAEQVDPILGKFHAAKWPYDRAKIWAYDKEVNFDHIMHDYTSDMRGIEHAMNDLIAEKNARSENGEKITLDSVAKERLMRTTALKIIANHPIDYFLHVLSGYLIAEIYVGNGWLGNINFLLPMTIMTLVLVFMVLWRPRRNDYAALALTGLTTIAYIFCTCMMEPAFPRYMVVAQIPTTIVMVGGLVCLLRDILSYLRKFWPKNLPFGPGLKLRHRGHS
ncbi:MAG: hypothetical protein QM537_04390 [Candidatus Symbiobacter sp.]|nr:hypothetical protein [Candidatus Symbiobacter sp.]